MITTNPTEFLKQLAVDSFPVQTSASRDAQPPRLRWPGFMNLSTLAEYLDVSVTTVSKMIKSGQLPQPTLAPTPKLRRWSRESNDKYLETSAIDKQSGPSIDDLMARSAMKDWGDC